MLQPSSLPALGRPQSEFHKGCPASAAGSSDETSALLLVLGYLRLSELLAFQRVSRLFRDAIAEDGLLWRRIAVERPLSGRLTDEVLLRLAARAGGRLESLALRDCWHITDDGLMWVVHGNLGIRKLHVPGCTRITADGVVKIVKWLYEHKGKLKSLQIYGVRGMTELHLDILRSFLFGDTVEQVSSPNYYGCSFALNNHDERPIDADICPRCYRVSLVFECTKEKCRSRKSPGRECRGCIYCIARCEDCGNCLDIIQPYEPTACSHLLCPECWLRLPKCSFCNRPYCKRHPHIQEIPPQGFVCERCKGI